MSEHRMNRSHSVSQLLHQFILYSVVTEACGILLVYRVSHVNGNKFHNLFTLKKEPIICRYNCQKRLSHFAPPKWCAGEKTG
jgi:hypothetical protein